MPAHWLDELIRVVLLHLVTDANGDVLHVVLVIVPPNLRRD
jgi:hypothetical protein